MKEWEMGAGVSIIMIMVFTGGLLLGATREQPGNDITEFVPPSATGIQCVYVDGSGVYCWPKMMNDAVQRWIDWTSELTPEEQRRDAEEEMARRQKRTKERKAIEDIKKHIEELRKK